MQKLKKDQEIGEIDEKGIYSFTMNHHKAFSDDAKSPSVCSFRNHQKTPQERESNFLEYAEKGQFSVFAFFLNFLSLTSRL